jgi:cytochrome oxidase Cu insertion factor (SCO1/SenC/PrrC family)
MTQEYTKLARTKRRTWLVVSIPLVVLLFLLVRLTRSTAVRPPSEPLPVFAVVPDFTLTERSGRTVRKADLLGRVWVADFIFTTCAGPCPELTLRMRSLQKSLKDHGEAVRLVSFTLDPAYDTPAVLKSYAQRTHADPKRWWFLTGQDEASLHTLVKEGFLQTVQPAAGGNPIIHSTYFVLIDRVGRIRAFYDGLDPESKPRILGAIDALLQEPTADG